MKKLIGKDFLDMIASSSNNLENHENEINTLNVFPVPDGDTGTNMSMTFSNGYKEASGCLSSNVCDIAKALSKGLLMGARGNSGVITSQIFRGFAKSVEGKNELTTKDISDGFVEGARTAYKAIMKPVEGTILTVIKEAAYYASKDLENNSSMEVDEYFHLLYKYANESLLRTPDLLAALKEAGVVDSGGAGLTRIFEGFVKAVDGEMIIKKDIGTIELTEDAKDNDYLGYIVKLSLLLNNEYRKKFDTSLIEKRLNVVSDILMFKVNKETIDIELNTLKPGEVLNVLQRYGEFISMDFTNSLLSNYIQKEEKEEKEFGLITVAAGEGVTKLFYELGADIVISGGQTMNPSTQDFLDKIDELNHCKTIFIFPNNSNIILAAEQAKNLTNKNVIVIPSKSIQAGLSSLAIFDENADSKTNENNLTQVALSIKTAQITYAVKDTSFDGVDVKKGDYLSIVDKTIIDSSSDLKDVCQKTIDRLSEEDDYELLTIVAGENSNAELNKELIKYAENKGKFEVEFIEGDQPVYSYLFGLE